MSMTHPGGSDLEVAGHSESVPPSRSGKRLPVTSMTHPGGSNLGVAGHSESVPSSCGKRLPATSRSSRYPVSGRQSAVSAFLPDARSSHKNVNISIIKCVPCGLGKLI